MQVIGSWPVAEAIRLLLALAKPKAAAKAALPLWAKLFRSTAQIATWIHHWHNTWHAT